MKLEQSQKAPDFCLSNQNGKQVRLSDFKNRWLLIYFYPKDDTPGCTKQACGIRDSMEEFMKKGLQVIGISTDGVRSHKKFYEKYNLPFDILADEKKEMVEAYGVWGKKKFMGREYMGTNRTSFLIDPDGKIVKIYPKVNPEEHADQVLKDFKELN